MKSIVQKSEFKCGIYIPALSETEVKCKFTSRLIIFNVGTEQKDHTLENIIETITQQ